MSAALTRRQWLAMTASAVPLGHAAATPEALLAAVRNHTGPAGWQPAAPGQMQLELAALVENGNTVPVSVRVSGPLADGLHVQSLALFTERNPLPEVAVFHLSRHLPRAEVATRMRLATSQQVLALAHLSDGRFIGVALDVVVTLAACLEG